jgi:hypothetical protein
MQVKKLGEPNEIFCQILTVKSPKSLVHLHTASPAEANLLKLCSGKI